MAKFRGENPSCTALFRIRFDHFSRPCYNRREWPEVRNQKSKRVLSNRTAEKSFGSYRKGCAITTEAVIDFCIR